MKTKLFSLLAATPLLLMSCHGSRPRRVIDAYGNAYDEYEKTGDPTMLVIMIVVGAVAIGVWLWTKKDK